MIQVNVVMPGGTHREIVRDIDAAERSARAAIFADAGSKLVEGHGLICHAIGNAMHHTAETEMIVNGRWSWRGSGYVVTLTPTEEGTTLGT